MRGWIAFGVGTLVVVLMAWDHLIGNQGDGDPFPVDAPTFGLAMGLAALTALGVTVVVRRANAATDVPTRPAVALAIGSLVTAPFLSWLAIPQVLAGGALLLGFDLLRAGRRGVAVAVLVAAVLALLFGVLGTAFPPVDTD